MNHQGNRVDEDDDLLLQDFGCFGEVPDVDEPEHSLDFFALQHRDDVVLTLDVLDDHIFACLADADD